MSRCGNRTLSSSVQETKSVVANTWMSNSCLHSARASICSEESGWALTTDVWHGVSFIIFFIVHVASFLRRTSRNTSRRGSCTMARKALVPSHQGCSIAICMSDRGCGLAAPSQVQPRQSHSFFCICDRRRVVVRSRTVSRETLDQTTVADHNVRSPAFKRTFQPATDRLPLPTGLVQPSCRVVAECHFETALVQGSRIVARARCARKSRRLVQRVKL